MFHFYFQTLNDNSGEKVLMVLSFTRITPKTMVLLIVRF
jgi:hypothetical protein